MKQVELTTKLVLAIIGLTSVSAILVPTYAVPTIKSADIFDGEVKTADLANNAVTTPKIADNAVTSGKISNTDGVRSSDIVNGEVKAEDIAAGVIPDGGGALPNVHTVVGNEIAIPRGSAQHSSAICPDGEQVTGGGYTIRTVGAEVIYSFPIDVIQQSVEGWEVGAANFAIDTASIQAYAVCMEPSQ